MFILYLVDFMKFAFIYSWAVCDPSYARYRHSAYHSNFQGDTHLFEGVLIYWSECSIHLCRDLHAFWLLENMTWANIGMFNFHYCVPQSLLTEIIFKTVKTPNRNIVLRDTAVCQVDPLLKLAQFEILSIAIYQQKIHHRSSKKKMFYSNANGASQ